MWTEVLGILVGYSLLNKLKFMIKKPGYKKLTEVIPGAESFFHKKSKEKGILFIHGFTSTAKDYVPLGKYLADKNISVHAILLKGHGTCPENMTTTNVYDWIKSAEEGLKKLKKHCKKVVVAGDSFGGNLALILASKYKVDGVITMGTPVRVKRKTITWILFLMNYFFLNFKKKWYHKGLAKKIRERITYKHIPLGCILDLGKGVKISRKAVKKVKAPILIMQSTTDFLVDERSVDYIFHNVKSKHKKVYWFKNGYHVFIMDKNKHIAFREIYDFIKNI